ncbi:hypothetical protein FOB31_19325 [Burkholderia multivorans]|nr:hypothetical protein C6P79_07255 [Burkholderia multivorans]QET32086.1 hypothetical protein FOB31_19325 [Burkholderia multivorans]QET42052.1 hypothetical protein FOB30_24535 [Burkholderia multivorans]
MAYVDISHSGLHLNLRFSCRMRRSGTRPVVLLVFVWPRRARVGLCRLCRIAVSLLSIHTGCPAEREPAHVLRRVQNMCRMPAITPS